MSSHASTTVQSAQRNLDSTATTISVMSLWHWQHSGRLVSSATSPLCSQQVAQCVVSGGPYDSQCAQKFGSQKCPSWELRRLELNFANAGMCFAHRSHVMLLILAVHCARTLIASRWTHSRQNTVPRNHSTLVSKGQLLTIEIDSQPLARITPNTSFRVQRKLKIINPTPCCCAILAKSEGNQNSLSQTRSSLCGCLSPTPSISIT